MLLHVVGEEMGLAVFGQGLAFWPDDEAGVVYGAVPVLGDAAAHDGDACRGGQFTQHRQGGGLMAGGQLRDVFQGIARVPQFRQDQQLRALIYSLVQQFPGPGHVVLDLSGQNVKLDSGGFDLHRPINSLSSSK